MMCHRCGIAPAEAQQSDYQHEPDRLRQVVAEQAAAHTQLQAAHKLLQDEAAAQRAAAADAEVATAGICHDANVHSSRASQDRFGSDRSASRQSCEGA